MNRLYTLIVILLTLGSLIHSVNAQDASIWMPDANLRNAVREDLGLANDEALTQDKMLDLTSLHAPQEGISDLTGLEHATNLTKLVAWQNQISNLSPIQNLTKLTEIRIGGNQISNITPLGGLTHLTRLGLQRNNISNISALANLAQLEWLRLVGNPIADAYLLASLANLTDVDIEIPPPPDTEAPGVSISVPSGVQADAFDVSVTFTESVSEFTQSELSLSGTASASITAWSANSDNMTYTATITPTSSGSVTLNVNAGVATDAANNQNTAATSQTVTVSVDTESPGVSISVPSGVQNGAFNATITFTEAVSDFTQSDVSLSGSAASITGWRANSGNTVYTATITPTASGTVTIGVAANVATDAANNQNTAATTKTVIVDVDAPTVTIGVPSGTQTGAFDATIMFSETVSGFVGSDVSLSGSVASITSWSANSDNTVYTATLTPTASGTVTVSVAANVATDAANNSNTAAPSQTVTVSVDTDAPGVSVSVPSGVQNGAFNATITFTESVSGFTQSDLSVGGTASASVTSWSANSDNTTYTATITPTSSGTVTLGIAAGVATDAANNPNTAATSKTVSVDIDRPTVTIGVPSGTQTGAFDATITFSETVSGFVGSDVSLTGSAASITGWSANIDNTVYTATITPTASGTVTIGVVANVATDGANNQNTAATAQSVTVSVDTTAPGVSITVPSDVQNGAFNAAITFTEAVTGFVQSDLSLSGTASASVTAWNTTDNTTYTTTITPTTSGTVTLGIAADVATDGANNPNTAAVSKTVAVSVDTTSPGVSISVPSEVQNSAFNVTITFTEAVSGFTQSDLSVGGTASASVTSWSANSDNTTYTATITPTSSGTVTLGVAAGVATDAANNQNTAATSKTVTVDADRPTVTIGVPSGTQTGTFDATIMFSETVSGFVGSDVSLTGSAASITGWSANIDNTVYTATITPTASGTVTIGVVANVATDGVNNQNTAATSQTVTVSVDAESPGVSISVPSGVQNSAFNVAIIFTEAVSEFTQSDLSLSGTASASITAWNTAGNTTHTATITPTSSGTVTLNVSASVATDAANNPNTAADSQIVTVDVDKPRVTISVPSGTQTSTFNAIIRFSEAVSGFGQSDVFLTGSEASITSWSANSGDTVYTATITPTASGTVTVSVAANVAADAANNSNTGATSQTVTVDVDRPTVTIGVPSGTQTGTFDATIMFSETVSGFVGSDVSLAGSAASITGWSANIDNTVYTATITPTASGTVTVGVDANVATDAANNQNTAAISQMVTVDVDRPTVSISVPSDVQNSAFDVTITFSEAVSDFEQSDMSLTGTATASITAWSANTENTVYTATIIPTTSGTAILSVAAGVATDIASNPNTAATPRTVTIAMPELVQDLTTWMPDANLRNAVRKALKLASDETFSQEDMQSLTRLSVLNRIMDLTGLEHATQLTMLDVMYSDISDISPLAGLTFLTTLDLRGNNISDVTLLAKLVNLEKLWLSDNPITDISPLAGLTALRWLVIMDANVSDVTPLAELVNLEQLLLAGNSITDFSPLSNLNNLQYADVEIPEPVAEPLEVSISVPSDVQNGAFDATITFSDAVSDFVQADVSLTGSAASITGWSANTDNTVYTATITPTTSGIVTLGVAANVATDTASNPNTAATSQTVTVDVDSPAMTIGVPSGVQNGAFNVTITFTELVSDFVQSEFSLTGTASASITAWSANSDNTTYTATITPTFSGSVTFDVNAGVATDAANNPNTAASSQTVSVDVDTPGSQHFCSIR